MKRWVTVTGLAMLLGACAHALPKTEPTTSTRMPPSAKANPGGVTAEVVGNIPLPPGEADAKAALNSSPRHGEYVDVAIPGDKAKLRTWVSYPERKTKAGIVLIIHEVYGLSDWIRGVADQLAAEGFIAVAPDLVSGLGPGGGGTDSAASRDDVVKLVHTLTPEMAAVRINAARVYAASIPAANGKIATLGFCWGGGKSFAYAANQPPPDATVVFYGVSPDSATLPRVTAPVLGNYGGDDARVDATIAPARAVLDPMGKTYEPHLYEGAGHGFLRAQADRDGANLRATREAWPRTIAFLRKYLE
jgi:carboxymethylenebutenolidase